MKTPVRGIARAFLLALLVTARKFKVWNSFR